MIFEKDVVVVAAPDLQLLALARDRLLRRFSRTPEGHPGSHRGGIHQTRVTLTSHDGNPLQNVSADLTGGTKEKNLTVKGLSLPPRLLESLREKFSMLE